MTLDELAEAKRLATEYVNFSLTQKAELFPKLLAAYEAQQAERERYPNVWEANDALRAQVTVLEAERDATERVAKNCTRVCCEVEADRDSYKAMWEALKAEPSDTAVCGRCGHTAFDHSNFGAGECQISIGCAAACHEFTANLQPNLEAQR